MRDIMVDLETLGSVPGSAIISIGAVAFDPFTGEVDKEGFYTAVGMKSCYSHKLTAQVDTLDWWDKQSAEARKALKDAEAKNAPSLQDALTEFQYYLTSFGASSHIRVWGNGSDFDNAMLSVCFDRTGIPIPWKFWNNRCFRTLKNLAPGIKIERSGTYHNALDDARTQAEHAVKIIKFLGLTRV